MSTTDEVSVAVNKPVKPAPIEKKLPPNVPRTAAQVEAQQALQSADIVIRTMQDDLREAKNGTPVPVGVKPAPPVPPPPAAPMPLPPKSGGPAKKVVMQPFVKRRHRSRLMPVLLTVLLLVLVGSGGLVWWLVNTPTPNLAAVVPGEQVIPATSAVVLAYHLSTAEERGALLAAWNASGRGATSVSSLLTGDPRLLLTEANIATFYYVLLENETRPYLVVQKSPETQTLFATSSDVSVIEEQGWYVVNGVSTDTYLPALAAGSLAGVGTTVFTPTEGVPLQVFVGPHALLALREALLGPSLANGLLQEVSFGGRVATGGQAVELSGQATTLEPLQATGEANQQFLSLIPAEADFVRLGSNFSHDLEQWAPTAGVLDLAVLQQPAVAALVQQLTDSYAFYTVSANPAARDFAFITTVPAGAALTLPDPPIEEALSVLLPLITGRKGVGPIEFSSTTHAGVSVRYANFSQPSQALDYALVDNHLVVTTSRESMFNVLETIAGTHTSVSAAGEPAWQSLLGQWGALPAAANLVLGGIDIPQIKQLFPGPTDGTPLFGVALGSDTEATKTTVTGLILLPDIQQP